MTETTFLESSKIQFNVLRALVLRDLVGRYGDSRLAFVWVLFRPMLVISLLYAVASLAHHEGVQGMPTLIFLCTGYLAWFSFEWTYLTVSSAPNQAAGVLMFPHLTLLDVIVSAAIVEWGTYTVSFLIIGSISILIKRDPFPAQPFLVLFFFWMTTGLGMAFGLVIIVVRRFFTRIDNFMTPIRRLGVLLSGVFMPAYLLPAQSLHFFSWNPLYRLIEIMRQAWYPAYQSPIATPGYVLICFFFMISLALVAERVTRYKA